MEINSDFNIFGKTNKNTDNKVYPNLAPLRCDTVSFSGKNSISNEEDDVLSDEEFKKLKKQAQEKINALPDDIKERYQGLQLTKNNIRLACKILQSDKLYEDKDFMCGFFYPIMFKSVNFKDVAKSKETVIDALLNSSFEYDNEILTDYFYNLIYYTDTQEQAQCASKLINTISNCTLADNQDFIKKAVSCVGHPHAANGFYFPQKSEALCMIFDTFGSSKFLNNEHFSKYDITPLAYNLFNQLTYNKPEKVKGGCMIIDKIADSPLAENEDFRAQIPRLLRDTETEESAKAKCILFDKVVEKGFYNNKSFMNNPDIFFYAKSEEEALARCIVLDKLADTGLIENENFTKQAVSLASGTYTQEEALARCIVLDKLADTGLIERKEFINNRSILEISHIKEAQMICTMIDKLQNEGLLQNEKFLETASHIISEINSTENMEAKSILLDKLIDTGLIDNEEFMKNFESKLLYTRKREGAEAKCILLDKLIDTGLIDKQKFINTPGVFRAFSYETVRIICEMIDKLQNEGFLYNENFLETASLIISEINSAENMKAKGILLDKISDNGLKDNENFLKISSSVFSGVFTQEEAKIRCMFIDTLEEMGIIDKEEYVDINKELFILLSSVRTQEEAEKKCRVLKEISQEGLMNKLTLHQINFLLCYRDEISPKELHKLNDLMGEDKVSQLFIKDVLFAAKFSDVYQRENINELTRSAKKALLRNLVSFNSDLFSMSEIIKESFPFIPTNQEEYCTLLPSIVRSLGIETNTLKDDEVQEFNENLSNLGNALSKLSDEEFNNLEITQEYDKDKFITEVLETVKDLDVKERQKIYDYFGFELYKNQRSAVGFSITGYPVNLNNGKKLAQITEPKTKETVEKLRPLVIKFSQNNKIKCTNKELEPLLNDIADVLPELRPQIGKLQAGNNGIKGSHDFDIFKHSLKVMQKVVQNPEFNKLNDEDKKIMLLASLMHDITKREGYTDETHALEGSFDSFFISKKFNLTQEEEIKLYTLIRTHEWLGKVNKSRNEKELEKNLQSTAYDLRYDNILDMSLIFTHADLMAVKSNNEFHDKTEGQSRVDFNGKTRSFGESADYYGTKIKEYTEELKKTQPLLPVTKIPSSDRINKAVTEVYPDGSTNIKGIYKDKDGLTVIKYNEVEDWEEIGFPKGSISRGIETVTQAGETVDTGNIKFFVHGLEYQDQLAKFDAFSLVDSDALLSVSYTERPESKYRFFRAQGLVLDTDTTYIHGGGENDSGSGHKKDINTFKNDYIFGGYRESDRTYISNLIKDEMGMTDDEYVKFVNENRNKSFCEIEPEELRERIIKAFASINSNERLGKRQYNEMYISNPKPPMAVFAYSVSSNAKINNPLNFLNNKSEDPYYQHNGWFESPEERTRFLRKYALEHNIPFIIFGD